MWHAFQVNWSLSAKSSNTLALFVLIIFWVPSCGIWEYLGVYGDDMSSKRKIKILWLVNILLGLSLVFVTNIGLQGQSPLLSCGHSPVNAISTQDSVQAPGGWRCTQPWSISWSHGRSRFWSRGFANCEHQWIFQVRVKYIITLVAGILVYTAYIPGIVLAFVWGLYNPYHLSPEPE